MSIIQISCNKIPSESADCKTFDILCQWNSFSFNGDNMKRSMDHLLFRDIVLNEMSWNKGKNSERKWLRINFLK